MSLYTEAVNRFQTLLSEAIRYMSYTCLCGLPFCAGTLDMTVQPFRNKNMCSILKCMGMHAFKLSPQSAQFAS